MFNHTPVQIQIYKHTPVLIQRSKHTPVLLFNYIPAYVRTISFKPFTYNAHHHSTTCFERIKTLIRPPLSETSDNINVYTGGAQAILA